MTIRYDCASAPPPKDVKLLCDTCREVLDENGYSTEKKGGMAMGKCSMCRRRAPLWPTRIKKAQAP